MTVLARRPSGSLLAIALLALASWGCSDQAPIDSPTPVDPPRSATPQGEAIAAHAPDSVIVKFRGKPAALALGGAAVRSFAHLGQGELAVVQLAKGTSVDDALARLRADPSVAYAEPNYTLHANRTPDDPRFAEQWGLHNTGQGGGTVDADIDAPEAWDITTGSGEIVVGVVDTGVDYNHPDLAANMWVNPREIAGNGVDDDGNGVIDDVHGYNAVTGSGDPLDENDHGSHCAGIIGA